MIYRNQLLFVYVKEWEAYGRHWVMAFKRIVVGLVIFLVTMAGLFISKGAPMASAIPLVMLPMTALFYKHCQEAFDCRTKFVPLDRLCGPRLPESAGEKNRPRAAATPDDSSSAFGPHSEEDTGSVARLWVPAEFSPPPSSATTAAAPTQAIKGTGTKDGRACDRDGGGAEVGGGVGLTPEEQLLERYPESYVNPLLAQPLPRPWLPAELGPYCHLLPRYSADGTGADDAAADVDDDGFSSGFGGGPKAG
ncbi:hypothetical protein HK405_008387 [Cladochytrium tenue]|nr:hypothetical protein HK405_008387 [Cladochytrium tenue]